MPLTPNPISIKKSLLFTILVVMSSHLSAAYLKDVPYDLKQPNGEVLHCFITGDEFYHRVHDKENFTILQNHATGYYVYAIKSGDQLVPSDIIAEKGDPRERGIEPGLAVSPKQIDELREKLMGRSRMTRTKSTVENPTTGELNNIVISIRFSDQPVTTHTADTYGEVFTTSTGYSLKTYFNEVSNAQLHVNSYYFPASGGQTIIEYQDEYPRAYYCPYDDTTNPAGYTDDGFNRLEAMLKKAILQSESQILASNIDFDKNNDGIIDNIIFIIQGMPEGWGDVLWPMSISFFKAVTTIGDKNVMQCNIQLSGLLRASVLCHEFFHALGSPDLYRYTNNEIAPVGVWDIMGNGSGHMLTFMKWKYGKWFASIPEIKAPGTYTLKPVSESPFACYKILSPFSSDEYFMVEYRKKEGFFESQLWDGYDEGLIIYRVNTNATGNASGPPDELYVYRPDGTNDIDGNEAFSAFSSGSGRTEFGNTTNPACFLQDCGVGGIQITNVTAAGSEISFTVSEANTLPAPANFNAGFDQGNIVFNWQAPALSGSNLTGYNIYRLGKNGPLNQEVITGLNYSIALSEQGELAFYLTAVYDNGQSLPVMAKLYYLPNDYVAKKDSLALVAFYNALNGPNWINHENWLKAPVKTWYGITTENSRVTHIWFCNNNLSGTLPPEIGDLEELNELTAYNYPTTGYISGPIPPEIGKLSKLRSISFQLNQLSGTIPVEIFHLSNLQWLELNYNNFNGTIPKEIGLLEKLESLNFSYNQLTGSIPKEIGQLTKLTDLTLWGNQLTGSIPSEIGNLTNLRWMMLNNNMLTGDVPESFTQIENVTDLTLEGNYLTGLPDLSVLKKITRLCLNYNYFTFKDLEPNMKVHINDTWNGSPGTFYYAPQRSMGEFYTVKAEVGDSVVLSVACKGTQNIYQWYKNGIPYQSPQSFPEMVFNPVTLSDNGNFDCKVTNPLVKDLTLEYNTVALSVKMPLPSSPTQIEPENGSLLESFLLNLVWHEVETADNYTVQVNDNIDFSNPLVNRAFIADTTTLVTGLQNNTQYFWRINAKNTGGTSEWSEIWTFTTDFETGIEETKKESSSIHIKIYPNPVSGKVYIDYILNKAENLKISIYNSEGLFIRTLADDYQNAGFYTLTWNLDDNSGIPVNRGIYFIKFVTPHSRRIEKVIYCH
jgi:M6 family metalloprotease-like protein